MVQAAASSSSTTKQVDEVFGVPAFYRLRKATIKPFGKAVGKDNAGTVATESTAAIQLGSIDPIEKAALDEITTLMQRSHEIGVVSPTAKRMKAKAAEAEARAKADVAKAAAASSTGASKAAAAASADGENLTWAEANRRKAEARAAATGGTAAAATGPGGRPGRPTDATVGADGKAQRRTPSGNIIDPFVVRVRNLTNVTDQELWRLFGPDNGLGNIKKVYLARGDKGIAMVTYHREEDAARAIAKMHGQKFKYLVLHVDHGIVRQGGPGGRR